MLRTINLFGRWNQIYTIRFAPDGHSVAVGGTAGTDNPIKVCDTQTGNILTLKGHESVVRGVTFSPDGRRLASIAQDETLRLWDAHSGRLLATSLSLPQVSEAVATVAKGLININARDAAADDNEWVVLTPEGVFDCSANAAAFIRWRVNNALFPVERYYRRFRRPDLLRQALAGQPIQVPDFSAQDMPPENHFVALRYDGPAAANAIEVTLETHSRYTVRPQDVALLVNGRPLPPDQAVPTAQDSAIANAGNGPSRLGGRGRIDLGDKGRIDLGDKGRIDLGDKPIALSDSGAVVPGYLQARRFTFHVPLPLGASEVRLRAIAYDSSGLGSNWAEMIPLSRPRVQPVPGNLYVLAVGISNYQRADGQAFKNLKFAARDAQALAARLTKEGQPLYQHVEVYNGGALVDGQATLAQVRAGLRWLQQKARPGQIDTVVVCLSGHGVSDEEGRYYFPTHEFDPHQVATTSLSGDELQRELGGKLRAKDVYLFVDTCHSGALAGARSDDLSFEVGTSGVYMMASSGSAQSSFEADNWGHGAFTLALLRSLARPDLARDGVIHFNVLMYAVPNEIAKLMREAQQSPLAQEPVVPLEGRRLDEPVAQPG